MNATVTPTDRQQDEGNVQFDLSDELRTTEWMVEQNTFNPIFFIWPIPIALSVCRVVYCGQVVQYRPIVRIEVA